jgi:hypothetical protein
MSNQVHRSRNGGQSWQTISPDLTTANPAHQGFAGGPITSDGTGVEVYGTIFAFEESPSEAGVLWAGSDDGRIHVSRDDGGTWTDVTPDNFPAGATVNSIDISPHAPGRVHIAAYKYREGDMRPYIFRTNDYGEDWRLLTDGNDGIPASHFTRVVREDRTRRGLLYAGTEFGMYVSFDDGNSWQSFQQNFPVTPVTDIQLHDNDLIVSTQGRSFWIMDDLTPLHDLSDQVMSSSAHLFTPRPAYRVFFGGGFPGGGPTSRRAQNPPDGAGLTYSLAEDVEETITITIVDSRGDTAKTFSSEQSTGPDLGAFADLAALFGFGGGGNLLPKSKGMHRVAWDLRYPSPKLPSGTIIFGAISQPAAPPGSYTVTLTVGDGSQTETLEVRGDPRSQIAQAVFDEQFRFLLDLGEVIESLADRTDELRSVREQSSELAQLAGGAGLAEEDAVRVETAAASLGGKLTAVEEEVLQTQNTSFYDPLDHPGQLASQLAYLYNAVAGGFGGPVNDRPTDAAVERLAELRVEVNEILGELQTIFDEDLAAFNDLIRSLGLDPVVVKKDPPAIS